MLVTAAPLIDIAPTRAGDDAGSGRRPVRQARRRDPQADQARPARARHARRDRRDAPAHRARLRRLHRSRPPARGDLGGLRDAPGGRHRRGLPGREPGPDADAAEVTAGQPRRSGRRGRDHPTRPDPGQRSSPVSPPEAGPRRGDLPPSEPGAGPPRLDGGDPLPGAGHADRDRGRRVQPRRLRRVPAGDGDVAIDPRDGEAPRPVPRRLHAPTGDDRGGRRGALSPGRRVRRASASRRATPRRSLGRPTNRRSSSCSTRPSSWSG